MADIGLPNLEIIFNAFNSAGIQLNLMQNSAISFMASFNKDELKAKKLVNALEEGFNVKIESGYTLLTIFNYNAESSRLKTMLENRNIELEQKSNYALQLVLN